MGLFQKIKKRGFKYAFAILFNRIVPAWIFRCRRFVVFELDPGRHFSAEGSKTAVTWCETEAEYIAVEELTHFKRVSSKGDFMACQAKLNGELVGAFWAAGNCFEETELGVRIDLRPEQIWLFAALVDKEHRGQGVHASVLEFIIPALIENGLKEIMLAVNPDNLGSYYVHKKYSSRTVGTVYAFRLFSMAICWAKGDIKCDRVCSFSSGENPIGIRLASK